MTAHVIFVCDSCGRDDIVTRIEEFSAMVGSLIPKRWSVTSRQGMSSRILCIGCTERESAVSVGNGAPREENQ